MTAPSVERTKVTGLRRFVGPVLIALAAVAGLCAVVGIIAWSQSDSAIARRHGEVTSIKPEANGRTEVCIKNATDAGSTYGNRDAEAAECWQGALEGVSASIGDCVVLQTEGETSYLRVETAEGC
jgi:hypothetical protein